MRRFINRLVGGEDPNRTEDVIHVKHGKNDHDFTFPLNAISSGTLTVGALRAKCSQATEVEPGRVSLVCSGKNLKDDAATLVSLGIGSGAKVLCMASQQKVKATSTATTSAKKQAPPKVLSPVEKIEAVREAVRSDTISAMMEEFVKNPPKEKEQREDTHRKITETIMAQLLKLDSIESEEPEIKARRKEVVREIYGIFDQLDRVLREKL